MTDTTDQQAVTVAQELDETTPGFLIDLASRIHAKTTPAMGFDGYDVDRLIEIARSLASVSSASAEPRKDTVAFVQDWLMNADYDPTQFDKGFAAAIDARHGFDDAALTAIAERFCAAPLPDTVCADLVAIKPMAGRSGTNLMTVAEAKAVLRSIFPEPVPATNQAGEVEPLSLRLAVAEVASCSCNTKTNEPRFHEGRCLYRVLRDAQAEIERLTTLNDKYFWQVRDTCARAEKAEASLATQPATSQEGEVDRSYETLDQATSRITKAAIAGSLSVIAKAFDDLLIDRDEWRDQHEALLYVRQQDLAALATQPATSQEGEGLPTDRYGETVLDRMRDHAENGVMQPQFREDLRALLTLAATPTPPTLSEDLRELSERLSEGAWGIQTMLQEPMWKPSRSHIEAARNLLSEAANAFRDDAGEPPNGDEATKAREPDTAALVVVAQRILDRGYVSSCIEEEREDHNALVAALAQVKAS